MHLKKKTPAQLSPSPSTPAPALAGWQQQSNGSLYLVVVDAKQINKMLVDILWQPMKQTAVRLSVSRSARPVRQNRQNQQKQHSQ